MFHGKKKAITFSYDDGVTQDARLIKLLKKYDLKATFNLNSGLMNTAFCLPVKEITVAHCKPRLSEVAKIYEGFEVAGHTLNHPLLPAIADEDEIAWQVEEDRRILSETVGYEVVGFAYPGGGKNADERVADILRRKTGVQYARTIVSSYDFAPQKDLFLFRPSVYQYAEWDKMMAMADEFLAYDGEEPKIFYIWSHAYEFDVHDTWDRLEEFFAMIAHKDDIFYGTNKEVLL